MTSRRMLLLDRIATLVLALLLIIGGAVAVWWWTGESGFARTTNTTSVQDVINMSWWPWASAVLGLVLIALGLRWILGHLGRPSVGHLTLTGSGSTGRLDVASSKVAAAAADAFAHTLGVRSAKGSIVRDRGQLVAHLRATLEPEADLNEIARQADLISAQLGDVLDRPDVRCSVELKVAGRGRSLPRVR